MYYNPPPPEHSPRVSPTPMTPRPVPFEELEQRQAFSNTLNEHHGTYYEELRDLADCGTDEDDTEDEL